MSKVLKCFLFGLACLITIGMKWANKAPLFLSMKSEYEQIAQREEVLTFLGKDTLIEHQLELLLNEEKEPLLFFSKINTPVCIDNICKPMDIQIYWNLVGEYVGYDTVSRLPLTKFDHDLFEADDYEKLHKLLMDKHSILERKEMNDLFDPNAEPEKQVTYQGIEVDAVTGATKKEIKESVVEGALYSCYTIWHLVHGSVVDSIKYELERFYTPVLAQRFLYSSHNDYQFYALQKMQEEDFIKEQTRLKEIFVETKPLVRTYILKKMPVATWADESVTKDFFETFPEVDINSRTLLIQRLNKAHSIASSLLLTHIEKMSRNQLKLFLVHVKEHFDPISPDFIRRFQEVIEAGNYQYSYMIEEFLEE